MDEQRKEVDERANELAVKAQKGDKQAKEELFSVCHKLINWLADKISYKFTSLNFEDTKQEICVVFEKCVLFYSPKLGTFKKYLKKAALCKSVELVLENRLVRIPRTFIDYKKQQFHGEEINDFGKIIFQKVNAKIEPEIEQVETITPADNAITDEKRKIVRNALKFLPERYREFLEIYYGIGTTPRNLEQIASEKGITRERVRQIRNAGLKLLKRIIEIDYKESSL